MAISKEFVDAVDSDDLLSVRLLMKNSLILDPSGASFSEMQDYANGRMSDLFAEHDGEIFKQQDEWDKNYFNEQTVKVVNNFSKERVDLLKSIVKRLYSDKSSETAKRNSLGDNAANFSNMNSEISGTKIAGGAVALVGAGLLIGGLVVTDAPMVVPIIGGAAMVAGAALFLKK